MTKYGILTTWEIELGGERLAIASFGRNCRFGMGLKG